MPLAIGRLLVLHAYGPRSGLKTWEGPLHFIWLRLDFKDVVTPYTHISEASRYMLYTIIITFDGIFTIS